MVAMRIGQLVMTTLSDLRQARMVGKARELLEQGQVLSCSVFRFSGFFLSAIP